MLMVKQAVINKGIIIPIHKQYRTVYGRKSCSMN
jgi:hypothetical protein